MSKTGWPSKGDVDEVGSILDNIAKYNDNLINMVCSKQNDIIEAIFGCG